MYDYSDGIEISACSEGEYVPITAFEGWKVAISHYKPQNNEKNIDSLERHLETDEVFILISGYAALLIGTEKKKYILEKGRIYNVKRGTWHRMCMEECALVAVVENSDTTKENTERIPL